MPRRLSQSCPACGARSLDYSMMTWSGRTPEGERTGGFEEWIVCADCKGRFGEGPGGAIVSPVEAAEYKRKWAQDVYDKSQAVFARRRREQEANQPPPSE